jgi:hypothetical protein
MMKWWTKVEPFWGLTSDEEVLLLHVEVELMA